MLPIKKILCPTDYSEPSLAALKTACELAKHFDAELRVLHVIPINSTFPSDIMVAPVVYYPSDKERLEEAQRGVAELISQQVPVDMHTVAKARMGNAAQEIVDAADDDNADVIVIGTQGLTGWRHLAFGSVAEEVVRKAHRPVLTVHGGPVSQREEATRTSQSAPATA